MLAAMSAWVRRLLDVALTRAIRGRLTLRRRVRSSSPGLSPEQTGIVVPIAITDRVGSAPASVPGGRHAGHPSCEGESAQSSCDPTRAAQPALDGVGGLRLVPPPPRESETPAHRVLRLGDAPESPIHSQDPCDWEDLRMPNGEVWLAPRGMQALGDRACAAFHLRRTFRLVE